MFFPISNERLKEILQKEANELGIPLTKHIENILHAVRRGIWPYDNSRMAAAATTAENKELKAKLKVRHLFSDVRIFARKKAGSNGRSKNKA
jgi:hypothetical protein